MKLRTAVLAAVLVLFAVSGGTAAFDVQDESPRNSPVVKVVKERSPSVVNISTERVALLKQQQPYQQAYAGAFDEFFKQNAQQTVSTMKQKPIKLADDVMIGETVVSIGNPFGLENSVSAGIISGTNRSFSLPAQKLNFTGLLQTDASINIGSSGGALLNLDGELVGINLAVVQGAQSIGFAIPVSRIKNILKQYDEYLKKTQS